ncbi:AraC family transcriptional regulator ligand-binding domain-containing protein, partial [Dokdonella sp.]|uniref:AraC family transcriptional regulator ligand-binding domain-containing protein n=1 Tax=Dokdonella sp. TaxID=2291710 RepID=UPI003C316747
MTFHSRTSAFLPARYYALLVQMVQTRGLDASQLLGPIGLDRAMLERPQAMLSPAQADALIDRAASMTGLDDLAMQLGRMIKPSSHEYLGYALMTSATLDEALQLASRYWRLITPAFQLSLDRTADAVHI